LGAAKVSSNQPDNSKTNQYINWFFLNLSLKFK
jgi:hypothetical protein